MAILHKNKGNLLQNISFDQVISAVIFIVRVLPLRALGEWGPPKITISLTSSISDSLSVQYATNNCLMLHIFAIV